MARHRFRGFGEGHFSQPYIAGPLIGGGACQVGIMLAHLHAKKNPSALRHAGLHGAILGGLVAGGLAMSKNHRETGLSALATVAIITLPRIVEGFMGLGHRHEDSMHGYLGTITASDYQGLSGDGEPEVQLLDSGSGSTGVLGTHVAEEMHNPFAGAGDGPVELLGGGGGGAFGSNFLDS